MENGFIILHRKIIEWEWYKNANVYRVFTHLLLMANHEDKKWQGISILRGQHLTSSDKLAIELGIGRQSVRTALNKLKSTNELTIKSTSRFSLITITKYCDYQDKPNKTTCKLTSKLTNNQPTTNQQLTTNNNDNNDNKIISKDIRKLPDPEISEIINYYEEKIGSKLDGTIKDNRFYCSNLIKKMRKEYPDKDALAGIKAIIEVGIKDRFHSKNMTNIKYIFYNLQKIIKSYQAGKSKLIII